MAVRSVTRRLAQSRAKRYEMVDERNLLLRVLITQTGWPAHLIRLPDDGLFVGAVCIHTPQGQLTWKLSRVDLDLFKGLAYERNDFDGQTRSDRTARLEALSLSLQESLSGR